LARRQYGHVTRPQLLAMGLSPGFIEGRLSAERLVPVHPGVYAVGPGRDEPIARAAAAVLASGSDALLSHSSAASLWGITARWLSLIEVTVAIDRRPRGIHVHRSQTLTRADRRIHLGIPVTSFARTVLDIAPSTRQKALTRAVNDGQRNGHLKLGQLRDVLARCANHPGAKQLRPCLEHAGRPTRSVLEDDFVAFTARYGLPIPETNTHVAGYEVDALFRAQRVIVELDGYGFHRDRTAFESDRERDAALLAAGYVTVRITAERLRDNPEREAARLREILRART
jgi:hypothetical protein